MTEWWKEHWRPLAEVAAEIRSDGRGLHGFDVPWLEVIARTGVPARATWTLDDCRETIQKMAVAMLVCRERISQLERAATVGREQR